MDPKRILLKLTGTILLDTDGKLSSVHITQLVRQLYALRSSHQFGIVIGGGNFFRGNQHGTAMGLQPTTAHQVGMLATMMNGLIIRNICTQLGLNTSVLCALPCPTVGQLVSEHTIQQAQQRGDIIIFTGGTGNPFFTTDTTAVLRALQMGADEIWKATDVDGIYHADPRKQPDARFIPATTYNEALRQNLAIMDSTAYTLAAQHNLVIRVFNAFAPDAFIQAAHNQTFGSILA
ncbi:MAG TPA: UMP kinase [Candidatus Dependentiae bacterium]|nr:UMP kinase [Candidatus Dependentiae bacterium]HRQ62575.1 UMP kinase [Candidatus Dependentiae bacterium]